MSKNNNPNNFSNNQGFNTINSQNLSRMNLPNQNSNNNSYRNYFSGNNQFFSQGTNNIYPVNEINNNLNMMQNMMFNYNCLWWNNNMNMLNTANQYMCMNNINFNNFPNVMDNDVNPLQELNAYDPILLTPLPITNFPLNPLQSLNASPPMFVTLSGIIKSP